MHEELRNTAADPIFNTIKERKEEVELQATSPLYFQAL
jgi:inosine-uridine nucleoside N-ribohydrolase